MTEASGGGDDPTDGALIARWLGGDERAATVLVDRHARPLARFVASLGAGDDVDEVVQDTFVRAFGALDGFRSESTFRTWLFTIARNLLRDRVRAVTGKRPPVPIQDWHATVEHDALDEAVARETRVRMREALGRLTPLQREVFALRVTEGMSYKEIAQVAGSTEGAARVHYFNAVRTIKEYLSDAG